MIKLINSAIIKTFDLPTYDKENKKNKEDLIANITSIFNKFLSIFFGNKPEPKKANLEEATKNIPIEDQGKGKLPRFTDLMDKVKNKKEPNDMPTVNIFEVYGKKKAPLPNDPLPLDKEFVAVSEENLSPKLPPDCFII